MGIFKVIFYDLLSVPQPSEMVNQGQSTWSTWTVSFAHVGTPVIHYYCLQKLNRLISFFNTVLMGSEVIFNLPSLTNHKSFFVCVCENNNTNRCCTG